MTRSGRMVTTTSVQTALSNYCMKTAKHFPYTTYASRSKTGEADEDDDQTESDSELVATTSTNYFWKRRNMLPYDIHFKNRRRLSDCGESTIASEGTYDDHEDDGRPGTGKTTTACIVGKLFYDMGFLSTTEVIECSATDLVAEYMGHSGPKLIALLDRALGKVLFIDEAYRLAERPKLWSGEMTRLLQMNPSLRSRFAKTIDFPAMLPKDCLSIWRKGSAMFTFLGFLRSWDNARGVEELSDNIPGRVFQKHVTAGELPRLSVNNLTSYLNEMLRLHTPGYKLATPGDQSNRSWAVNNQG
ncbi:hypothetical protein BDW59DRAFT_163451 [Aspergillus cavernicola]|uniref:ATPase AAA-type core domain-containing protein n=1 Tax=Aspergillus cavernicola TaxID=176166 RepID=A0ABR4I7P4_9EURO